MSRFDTSLLELLEPKNVLSFIASNGWTEYSIQKHSSVWVKNGFEVLIPEKGVRDYLPRIFEALQEISAEQGEDLDTVFRSMLMSGFEVLQVSSRGPSSKNGTVSFEDGITLIANIRDLLTASASAVIDPRRVYLGKRSELTETFLREARLGQTEHGSFIITVLAPILRTNEQTLPTMLPSIPFGSRVLQTLLNATQKATVAAESSLQKDQWFDEHFVPLVAEGVSANMCAAINGLLSVDAADSVVFTTRSTVGDHTQKRSVEIPATLSNRFALAAEEFRKSPPLENVLITGKTISYRRGEGNGAGKVSVKAEVGGEQRRIVFDLPREYYETYLAALTDDEPISFIANLTKSARSYEASDIRKLVSHPQGYLPLR